MSVRRRWYVVVTATSMVTILCYYYCKLVLVLLNSNLSCASKAERQAMRNCDGLIDSIVTYIQSCVAVDSADDMVSLLADTNNPLLFLVAVCVPVSALSAAFSNG